MSSNTFFRCIIMKHKRKHNKYDIFMIFFFRVFIIMYLKMHYYIKVYNVFFRVFIITYLNNALLDVLFSHFWSQYSPVMNSEVIYVMQLNLHKK